MSRQPESAVPSVVGAGLSLALAFAALGIVQDLAVGAPEAYQRLGFVATTAGAALLYFVAGFAAAWLAGSAVGLPLRCWGAAISVALLLTLGAYDGFFRWAGAVALPLPLGGGTPTRALIAYSGVFFLALTLGLRRVEPDALWRRVLRIAQPAALGLAALAAALWGWRFEAGPGVGVALAFLALGGVSLQMPAERRLLVAAVTPTIVLAAGALNWSAERTYEPASQIGGAQGSVPRVILITIDTLRADALAAPAAGRPATPNLDAFAAESFVFENGVSSGAWTQPGVTGLLTGLDPFTHRVGLGAAILPQNLPTLPERMAAAGYQIAGSGLNPVVRQTGLAAVWPWIHWHPYRATPESVGAYLLTEGVDYYRWNPSSAQLVDFAIDWLDGNAGAEFFYWLHFYDPHVPYSPPSELVPGAPPSVRFDATVRNQELDWMRHGYANLTAGELDWVHGLYNAEVEYVDRELGRYLARLEELGVYDDALIVVSSDHGEEFFEHGGFEHGHTLYQELLHVPLIVRPPGGAAGRRAADFVSTASVTPTVLDLAGVDYDPAEMTYPSLRPYLEGAPDLFAEPVFSAGVRFHENWMGVVFDDYKYIQRLTSGREELYDLAADPRETVNLQNAELLERGRTLIAERLALGEKLRERLGIGDETAQPLDDATRRQLESLGYIQ